jgi:hypothetical protein
MNLNNKVLVLFLEIFSIFGLAFVIFSGENSIYPFRNDAFMTNGWNDVISLNVVFFSMLGLSIGVFSSIFLSFIYGLRLKSSTTRWGNLLQPSRNLFLTSFSVSKLVLIAFHLFRLLPIFLAAKPCTKTMADLPCYFP